MSSLITTHGAEGTQAVDFSQAFAIEDMDIASKGGFVVDCNHGRIGCEAPADDIAAQWQYLKDHPFGITADPYSGTLPSSFPQYCKIIK